MKFLLKSTLAIVALTGIGVTATSAGIFVVKNNEEKSLKNQADKNFNINLLSSNFYLYDDTENDDADKYGKYGVEFLTIIGYTGDANKPLKDEMVAMDILFYESITTNDDIFNDDENTIQIEPLPKGEYTTDKYNSDGIPFYIPPITLSEDFKKGEDYKVVLRWEELGDEEVYYSNIYNFDIPNSAVTLEGIETVYEGVDDSIIQIDLKMSNEDYRSAGSPEDIQVLTRYIFEEVDLKYLGETTDLLAVSPGSNKVETIFVENSDDKKNVYWSYQVNLIDVGVGEEEKVPVTISYIFNSKNISAGDGYHEETITITPREQYKSPIIEVVENKDTDDPFTELSFEFSLSRDDSWPEQFDTFYSRDDIEDFNAQGMILPEELLFEDNIKEIQATLNGDTYTYNHANGGIIFNDNNEEEDKLSMEASYVGLSPETEYEFELKFIMGENAVIEDMEYTEFFSTKNKYKGFDMTDNISIETNQEDTLEANEHNGVVTIDLPDPINTHPYTTFDEFVSLEWSIVKDSNPEQIITSNIVNNDSSELNGKGIEKTENGYLIDIYQNGGICLEAYTEYTLNIDFTMSENSNEVYIQEEGIGFTTKKNNAPPTAKEEYVIDTEVVLEDASDNSATTTFSLRYPSQKGNILHSNNIVKMQVIDNGSEVLGEINGPFDKSEILMCEVSLLADQEYDEIELKIFLSEDTNLPNPDSSIEINISTNSFTIPVESFNTGKLERPGITNNNDFTLTYSRIGDDLVQGLPDDMYTVDFSLDMFNINNIKDMSLVFTEATNGKTSSQEAFEIPLDIPKGDNDDKIENKAYSETFSASNLSFDTEYNVSLSVNSIDQAQPIEESIDLGSINTPNLYGYISEVPKVEFIGSNKDAIEITFSLEEIIGDEDLRILYTWNDEDGEHTLETNNIGSDITQQITIQNGKTISDIKIEIFGLESYISGSENEILYDTYYKIM